MNSKDRLEKIKFFRALAIGEIDDEKLKEIKALLDKYKEQSKDEPLPYKPSYGFLNFAILTILENNKNDCYLLTNKYSIFTININNELTDNQIENLIRKYKECKKNKKVLIVPLHLPGHSNLLIFNTARNEIERFEPHGEQTTKRLGDADEKANKLGEELTRKFNEQLGDKIKYIKPVNVCPSRGLQTIEAKAQLKTGLNKDLGVEVKDQKGYCQAWSMIYGDLRIRFPKLSNKDIIKALSESLNNDPEIMRSFLRGQISNVIDNLLETGKRLKINIKKYIIASITGEGIDDKDIEDMNNKIQRDLEKRFKNLKEL